ncbi:MAG: transglutaminase-like domain-containing protein [Burkholderiaceae bacterium]|nr:transglutaminase-like domain-containing protein [Burkholderiaceae bacterium]
MAGALPWSLRALGGTLGAQWERERRETLFLMAPVALSVLPHVGHLPWWVGVGFFVLFLWRLGLVMSGRWLPRASVRWVAAIACTAAVYAHYQTVFGREPGVALLVLFLGLKLMEMQARRDLFVVIFLCFFLLLTVFFHSQSIATAAAVALALYALLTAMLTMQFRHDEMPLRRRFRSVGLMLAQALPIAAVIFVLFPRAGGPLWGLPSDAQRARTGLSDAMTPGNIAQLSESDEIAFRVLFDGDAPPTAQLYWRGPVFGAFDGQTWRAGIRRDPPSPPRIETLDANRPVRYTMTLEPAGRSWLFALEMPVQVQSTSVEPLLRRDLQLVSRDALPGRTRVTLVSSTAFRVGLDETAASLREWLALPQGFNPRTIGMATRWRAEAGGTPQADAALVERALAMFRTEPFRYTLEPPLLGRDSVDDFLFGSRAGFCEHYASAFTVLMRALGIPARIVTGYQGGERNPVDGYWLVRQADAHAWSEVWLDGRGWIRVDPTAAVAPQRIERGLRIEPGAVAEDAGGRTRAMLRQLWFNLDAIGNAWNQWILSYDRSRQRGLLERIGITADDWRQLAALLAAVLTAVLGGIALLTLRPQLPRDPVMQAYATFCARLAAVGLGRFKHETASRHLARIARALDDQRLTEARRIVMVYERLRYADAEPDRATVRHLRKSVQAFKP